MRFQNLFVTTLRENPADAEVVSHQLLVRAGYIRRLTSGVYTYMPLMWRVLKKVETIVREEMDRTGAQELLMPILQPREIWEDSGRWAAYGKELIRLKDRHGRDCVLGPTHEEVITTLAKGELRSYRQLPVNLYQIQNKYRDEIRPRFGLLRGREFIMKDAYSFHTSDDDLDREYQVMAEAYTAIFKRCGLETRMVRSDSGAIGGDVSHEFMVLTRTLEGEQESGENDVFFCDGCGYSANANRAESVLAAPSDRAVKYQQEIAANKQYGAVIPTPGATSIEKLDTAFGIPPELILKSLIYMVDEKTPVMALIRGDLDVEETKLQNAVAGYEIRLATAEEVATLTGGSSKGFIGPLNLPGNVKIVADKSVEVLDCFAMATNEVDAHKIGCRWNEEVPKPVAFIDIRTARVGDGCPDCGKPLEVSRGIEVGNIFKLGTKYSKAMEATYSDEDGTEKPFIMGCYGIGVSRVAASAVEQFHDKDGICWPKEIAPYLAVIVIANVQDETQMAMGEQLYQSCLAAGLEVVLDDRDERAGVKFKDADLIGFPVRVTVGRKAAEGLVEFKLRNQPAAEDVPATDVLAKLKSL